MVFVLALVHHHAGFKGLLGFDLCYEHLVPCFIKLFLSLMMLVKELIVSTLSLSCRRWHCFLRHWYVRRKRRLGLTCDRFFL